LPKKSSGETGIRPDAFHIIEKNGPKPGTLAENGEGDFKHYQKKQTSIDSASDSVAQIRGLCDFAAAGSGIFPGFY